MSTLRATIRLLLIAVANAVLYPFGLATRLPTLWGDGDAALRWGARVQRAWAWTNAKVIGLRMVVEPSEGGGRGEAIGGAGSHSLVVANHCSYLDIFVLGVLYPGRFVAKREIAGWPLIGPLSRSVGTIFVDQSRPRDVVRVGEEMRRTLDAGVSVVLFPEGRAHRGAQVEPFHGALFAGAARSTIPCLPVAIHYTSPGVEWGTAWTVCWWGGMDLQRHFWRLLGLPHGVVARVRPAPVALVEGDRRVLKDSVRASLEACFEPMTQGPVPPDNPWPELVGSPEGAGDPVSARGWDGS